MFDVNETSQSNNRLQEAMTITPDVSRNYRLNKYIDRKKNVLLEPPKEAGAWKNWIEGDVSFPYAAHPQGFLVFLSSSEIKQLDEYCQGDPYNVNLEQKFHYERAAATLDIVETLVSALPERPKILDAGCGRGIITEKVQQMFEFADMSGCDASISAIETASQRQKAIEFIVADVHHLPYCSQYFDLAILNNIWEHVLDPLLMFREMMRIVKPGGYFVISTPSRYRLGNMLRIVLGRPVVFMSNNHITEYTVGQMMEMLRWMNVEICNVFSPSYVDNSSVMKRCILLASKWPIATFLRLIGSHHSLESTVYYVVRKRAS